MRKPITNLNARCVGGRVEITWLVSTPLYGAKEFSEFSTFRILRKENKDFVYGEDYEEYFLGLPPKGSAVVFEGTLKPSNDRRYTFIDKTAETGKTYSYFVRTKRSQPIGPLPVTVRDHRVYWSYDKIMRKLHTLERQYPSLLRLSWCGETSQNRPIPYIEAGRGRVILGLVGLVHAGESGAELIIPVIASLLRSRPDLLQKARVTAIPILNIDSREKIVHGNPWYLRKSHAGVDLNRNFPAQWDTVSYAYGLDSSDPDSLTYRGRSCGGTPEVRAAVSAIKRSRPRIIFSYHGQQSLSSLPVVASAVAAKDAGYRSRCEEAIEVYGTSMFRSLSFHKNWIHWAATEGSLATWAYELDRIPAFDIEMGLNQRDVAAYRKGEAGVRMLRKYQNLHAKAMTAVIEALLP